MYLREVFPFTHFIQLTLLRLYFVTRGQDDWPEPIVWPVVRVLLTRHIYLRIVVMVRPRFVPWFLLRLVA